MLGILAIGILAATTGNDVSASGSVPRAFIQSLYTDSRGMPDYQGENASKVFTRSLALLERRFEKLAENRQLDGMDYDINELCGCQDSDKPVVRVTTMAQTAANATEAVTFSDQGTVVHYQIILSRTNDGWRIADFKITTRRPAAKEPLAHR